MAAFEDALASGWRRLRFRPALEAAYERDTGATRTLRHIVCNLFGIANFWLISRADSTRLPEIGALLHLLRWTATGTGLAIVLVLVVFRGSLRDWQRETLTAVGTLLITGYSLVIAARVSAVPMVMQLSGVLLIFLHVSIGARLQFRFAVTVNLLTWVGYAFLFHGDSPQAVAVANHQLLLFGMVVLFGSAGNYLLEFRERRGYLLQCLKSSRHDALQADAQTLRQLAMRDGLTRLYNRRHFEAELARLWRAGLVGGQAVGLLQVDVDHFKAYNDRYGHPAGDSCLLAVAAALNAAAEAHGGIAARVGGEEFAILLPGVGEAAIGAVAADVGRRVRALMLLPHASGGTARVTVSVGAAAVLPATGLVASCLVDAADAALYTAKRQGRDRWVLGRLEPGARPVPVSAARAGGDSLSLEPQSTGDELLRIERLSDLLAGSLRRLRFPPDLETSFQEQDASGRRGLLALLVFAGLAFCNVYVWLSSAALGNVADLLLGRTQGLSLLCGALVMLSVYLRVGWKVREGIVSAIISVFALCIIQTESLSNLPTVYTVALGLCLLSMFSCLIAAQPLRFSLVPSLVTCIGAATLLKPQVAEWRIVWLNTVRVLCFATLYSLVGGYLLELAKRRAWLLDRLRLAQLAVLRHNTEHLQRLATLDSLTRLPNRRHFEAELDRLAALCAESRQPLALLILDIDHFKPYNDGYGHPAGDACLRQVGAALALWARGVATGAAQGAAATLPARLGGEEFAVLLPDTDASTALAAAQQLRLLMRDLRIEHAHSPVGPFLTVSVGAASLVLASGAEARLLLTAADAALYRAKGLGRDRVAA